MKCRRRTAWIAVAIALAMIVAACGDDDDEPTDDTTADTVTDDTTPTAVVEMTLAPDPTAAVASENATYEWQGVLTVRFVESGGVGVTVSSLSVTVQQSSGGIVLPVTDPENPVVWDYQLDNDSNYIAANSTVTMGLTTFYTLPNGLREALITVQASLTDDNGAVGTFGATATVSPNTATAGTLSNRSGGSGISRPSSDHPPSSRKTYASPFVAAAAMVSPSARM